MSREPWPWGHRELLEGPWPLETQISEEFLEVVSHHQPDDNVYISDGKVYLNFDNANAVYEIQERDNLTRTYIIRLLFAF